MPPPRRLRRPRPPTTLARPVETVLHGKTVVDAYAWLKASNWRDVLKDPAVLPLEIRANLEAENAYSTAMLKGTRALRRTLVKEMRGRIKEDDATVPEADGPWGYYTRHRRNGQHPLVCRQPRDGGREQVLLDGDKLGKGLNFFEFGDVEVSPDHALLAWGSDDKGSEYYRIKVRDLATGRDIDDVLEGVAGQIVWGADSASLYYVELDDNHRPAKVRRHRLGQAQSDDATVYEEPDAGWFVDVELTQSDDYVVVATSNHEQSEAWLIDRADPDAAPRLVVAREPDLQYELEHRGDTLYILTNADGAEDFKIVTAPVADPARSNWRDLVPYRPGVMILYHAVLAGHMIRLEREDAKPRIVIRDLVTGEEHEIAFAEETYSLSVSAGREFDSTTIRFGYSSMATPSETWDYDVATRARVLRKRQEVPSGHDPSRYITRRLFATSHDGEQVPISIVHRADIALDGTAPCLLYGYGSYGSSMAASFRTNPLSLVDRGFVYAIAHIRGGTEKGWNWYVTGKRENKPNTFKDFIACGRALTEARYTSPERLVAFGGSAGGMLMGAVANMAPDLFAAIIADVPFVDVLNTMLDSELPLTPPEWPEWGNPGNDPKAFETILSYSPYDNIAPRPYPAILALGGLTDPRVTYWEPAKWVARLRATMTGGGPVLMKINMDAGHGGAAGRFDRLEEVGLIYAFALQALEGFAGSDPAGVAEPPVG
jgi:oligopeptidase B